MTFCYNILCVGFIPSNYSIYFYIAYKGQGSDGTRRVHLNYVSSAKSKGIQCVLFSFKYPTVQNKIIVPKN
jgi:hypothetical protein